MKNIIALSLVSVALSGCAWSAEGLGRAKIENEYTSLKKPSEVAGCIASRLMGVNPAFQQSENHWVVTRSNGYGIPIVRWDVIGTETGSKIEFRRSVAMMSGEAKALTCY